MHPDQPDALTVTDVTTAITQACQHLTPQPVWITGTLTSWKRSRRWGRGELAIYQPGSTNLAAKIPLGCPAKTAIGIERGFAKAGRKLTTGSNIVLLGQLDFHPVYGLRINVTTIRSDLVAESQRQQDRLAYLTNLQDTGRLHRQQQLTVPTALRSIGLVSPEGGDAGRQDVLEILDQLDITVTELRVPTSGPNAPADIRRALSRLESQTQLILCVRGGGAASDLTVWDDPQVVDAIALTMVPVIVGVGHATDTTLAKAVAHHGAATPTAAAHWLAQHLAPQPEPIVIERAVQTPAPATSQDNNKALIGALVIIVLVLAALIIFLMATN